MNLHRVSEKERLFINEPLIIADVMRKELFDVEINGERKKERRWKSHAQWVQAILFFEMISTGNAADETWNISAGKEVMATMADIIDDHPRDNGDITEYGKRGTPPYIRNLFKTYLEKQKMPRFDGILKIEDTLDQRLRDHLFERSDQSISQQKVSSLFPNAFEYMNEQGYFSRVDNITQTT